MAKTIQITREQHNILKNMHNDMFDTLMRLNAQMMCIGQEEEYVKEILKREMQWYSIYVGCLENIIVQLEMDEV